MGQGFSLFNNDDINLNAYNTENFSSTIPYSKKLYADASTLANRLSHSRKQFSMWDEMPAYTNYKMYEQSAEIENDNNFSDTSPFITTDVYKNLINEQLGGDYDDSTSSTSASSSSSSSDKKKKKHKKESEGFLGKDKKDKKKHKQSPIESEDSNSNSEDEDSEDDSEMHDEEEEDKSDDDIHSGMSSNVLSNSDSNDTYESSSAHTDNVHSNTDITTVSAKYYRNHSAMSDSINTSDINIISVEN